MKLFLGIIFAALPLLAQSDPEAFRVEITASGWRTGVEGTLQAGTLPIDLRSDLNLSDRFTFFGKLVVKPARNHAVVVEGAPFRFEGPSSALAKHHLQRPNLFD